MSNQSSNNTDSNMMQTNEAERVFKVVFYIFLFLFGTVGNLLVMVVIKAKKQRSVNDYFILNLAISDLTFVWLSLPFYTYSLFHKFAKFQFYCRFAWPMMSVTLCVSIFTLAFMSIERCRAIVFPLKPRISRASIFVGLVAVWISSIICILPLSIVTEPQEELCIEQWPSEHHRKAYTVALFVIQYALPVLIIAVAYITIAVKLLKTKVPNRTSLNSRGQIIKAHSRKENFHIIRTVAVIVVLFMVCMLPNQIGWLMYDFGGENQAHIFWAAAEALIYLHACVNPVIYGSFTRQFREGYIRYIRYVCCCGKPAKRTLDFYDFRESHCATYHRDRLTNQSMRSTNVISRLMNPGQGYAEHSRNVTATSPITTPPSRRVNGVMNYMENNLAKAEVIINSIILAKPAIERGMEYGAEDGGNKNCDALKRDSSSIVVYKDELENRDHNFFNSHRPPKGFKESQSEPNLQSCKNWRIDSLKRSKDDTETFSTGSPKSRRSTRRKRKSSAKHMGGGRFGPPFLEGSNLNYGIEEDEDANHFDIQKTLHVTEV